MNAVPMNSTQWAECHDRQHRFSFRYPTGWRSTTEEGTCVQLQKGAVRQPGGVPEGDIFIRVIRLPPGLSEPSSVPLFPQEISGVDEGIEYTNRDEVEISALPAVRASFRTKGPTPNWGVEYAIKKGDLVLDFYVSQPSPEILNEFEDIVHTLNW